MTTQTQSTHEPTTARSVSAFKGQTAFQVAVFLAIFFAHLAFGLWFYTSAPNNAPKTNLRATGDAYLATVPGWDTTNERDASAYIRAACEMMRTGVPRSREGLFFDHAPLYACFLAACYWVGGICLLSVAIPQAVLAGLIGVMLALAALRLATRNHAIAAFIAAGLILISVRIATFAGYVNPCILTLAFFCLAFLSACSGLNPKRTVIFVVAMLLGVYTTASFFLVGLAAAGWLALQSLRGRRFFLLVGAAAILGGAFTKMALTVRQGDSLHDDNRGTLWECNNPEYERMGWWSLWDMRLGDPPDWPLSEAQIRRHADYLERSGNDRSKAGLLWVRENPGQYAKLCFVRLRAVLGPIAARMRAANRLISTVWWLMVFPAGFYGLWRLRRLPVSILAALVILALVSFETLVMAGLQPRYRLPMDLMLVVYAAAVYAPRIDRLLKKLHRDRLTPAP